MKYLGRRRCGDRLHEQGADRIVRVAAGQFSDVEPEPAAPHECAASWFIGDGLIRSDEKVHADAAAGRSAYAIRMDAYAGRIASKDRRILLVANEKTNLMRISKPEIDLLLKTLKIGSKL